METNRNPEAPYRPSPAEADAALRDVQQAQAAIATTQAPWWYFVGIAVLVAPAPLIQFVPDPPIGVFVLLGGLVVWMLLFGVLIGAMVRTVGVVPRVRGRAAWIPVSVMLVLAIATGVLYAAFDLDWAPTALAEVIAAAILVYGIRVAVTRPGRTSA